ncbi:hypothetical protein A7981_02905 [Methylovorus sp. MM2]|uniref:hypothetical protein n=1 Tax=Methylovorus sp. MM2 TaxID=1848038 RepID=UPI0007E0B332|nr:hypothetical protein [Methylovorus sp. MM2]OAM52445.1 hypothetical protein A7981_02905 [Methylovorus sp. MM2]
MTKPIRKRDAAGGFELEGGTGGVTAFCSMGDVLEAYKVDRTFRIKSPQSIDPEDSNPDAPWVIAPSSKVGSGNSIVARVLLQSEEILKTLMFEDTSKDKLPILIHMHSCKESLLICESNANKIIDQIDSIIELINNNGLTKTQGGRGINPFPQVDGLEEACSTFLINANKSVRLMSAIPQKFFGLSGTIKNLEILHKKLVERFGESHHLSEFVRDNSGFSKWLIDLRNFHEHADLSRTVFTNFEITPAGLVRTPTWGIEGEVVKGPLALRGELVYALEYLMITIEAIFLHCVQASLTPNLPWVIYPTPDEELDITNPIKFRLTLDHTKMNFPE